jgi:hypothetical protein
MVLIKSRIFN